MPLYFLQKLIMFDLLSFFLHKFLSELHFIRLYFTSMSYLISYISSLTLRQFYREFIFTIIRNILYIAFWLLVKNTEFWLSLLYKENSSILLFSSHILFHFSDFKYFLNLRYELLWKYYHLYLHLPLIFIKGSLRYNSRTAQFIHF